MTDTLAPGDITTLLGRGTSRPCSGGGILTIEKPVHSRVLAYALLGMLVNLQEADGNKSNLPPPDTDAA